MNTKYNIYLTRGVHTITPVNAALSNLQVAINKRLGFNNLEWFTIEASASFRKELHDKIEALYSLGLIADWEYDADFALAEQMRASQYGVQFSGAGRVFTLAKTGKDEYTLFEATGEAQPYKFTTKVRPDGVLRVLKEHHRYYGNAENVVLLSEAYNVKAKPSEETEYIKFSELDLVRWQSENNEYIRIKREQGWCGYVEADRFTACGNTWYSVARDLKATQDILETNRKRKRLDIFNTRRTGLWFQKSDRENGGARLVIEPTKPEYNYSSYSIYVQLLFPQQEKDVSEPEYLEPYSENHRLTDEAEHDNWLTRNAYLLRKQAAECEDKSVVAFYTRLIFDHEDRNDWPLSGRIIKTTKGLALQLGKETSYGETLWEDDYSLIKEVAASAKLQCRYFGVSL